MNLREWVSTHYEEDGIAIKWVAFSLEVIAALALMALMLITCVDVVGRYLLNSSLEPATELTEIGLAILVFAILPVVTWRGGHVVVDMLDGFLGSKIIQVLASFSVLVMSGSMYYLGVRIFYLGERSVRRSEETEYLAIPVGYVVQYIAIMSWLTAATVITYGLYRVLKSSTPKLTKEVS